MLNESIPKTTQNLDVRPRSPKLLTGALVLIGFLAALFIGAPARFILGKTYAWQLKQPETVQGGIELVTVFLILVLASFLIRRPRVISLIIVLLRRFIFKCTPSSCPLPLHCYFWKL